MIYYIEELVKAVRRWYCIEPLKDIKDDILYRRRRASEKLFDGDIE